MDRCALHAAVQKPPASWSFLQNVVTQMYMYTGFCLGKIGHHTAWQRRPRHTWTFTLHICPLSSGLHTSWPWAEDCYIWCVLIMTAVLR